MNLNYSTSLQPQPDGIWFDGHHFTEPSHLLAPETPFRPPEYPGVYVILTDALWCAPRPFAPLYFGQSHDMLSRASQQHENYESWRKQARLTSPGLAYRGLYRSFHYMFGSTKEERETRETQLIQQYQPPCNERYSAGLTNLDLLREIAKLKFSGSALGLPGI